MNNFNDFLAACRERTSTLATLFDSLKAGYGRLIASKHAVPSLPPRTHRTADVESHPPPGHAASSARSLSDSDAGSEAESDADDFELTRVQSARSGHQHALASVHGADADATVVKPASSANSRRTGTGNSAADGSLNRASWQSLAEVQSVEHASVGMLLKGRFLLERELGRGGMGVVYLAKDERKVEARDRDPYVAVKVLNDEFRRHPDALIALQREARRAQRLADDHIVHVYDFDKDGTIVYMTMEYIDGTDLRTLIRERASGGMPFDEAWPLIEGMAHALQRAHASGIVHSDFKPGNVMVTRDYVAKVFDFGIARAGMSGAGAVGEQTVFDAGTLGALTPAYASLEMIEGAHPAVRDDVYALGCVIFELLTGSHPFDRHSADVAMKEGRQPPVVAGLSRRQQKALCDAVAFHGEERPHSVEALIDGLRRRSTSERLAPYVGTALAVAALAAGGAMLHTQMRHRQLETAIERLAAANPQHYVNENQMMTALDALGEDERERAVLDQSEAIQAFLLERLDAYWNPTLGRFDYGAVRHVFELRDRLKLFSPTFDGRRKRIEDERNDLLGRLGGDLDQASERDALFEDQPGSAAEILERIRALDPGSALLKNSQLESKYDAAIGQSIDLGQLDKARSRMTLALQLFPDSMLLQQRHAQLDAAVADAAAHPDAHANRASVDDARRALTQLAARPAASSEWLDAVTSAMSSLRGDDAPETEQAIEMLVDGIITAAEKVNDPGQAQQYLDLVQAGLRYAPRSTALAAQRDRMQDLLQQQKIDQQIASGDPASLMDAVRLAASANDGPRALTAFERLRTLQPSDPFVSAEGRQLVAAAFLGNARALCQQGLLADAAKTAAQGAGALSDDARLSNAAQRYQVAASILAARSQPMADPDYQTLRARYASAAAADPDGMQQLEGDLGVRVTLPQGGLRALLDQIKTQNPDTSGDVGGDAASTLDGSALPASGVDN
ncbi:serine/threonine-protein kinase [Paraburkholderia phenazinium]|uniref:Non-specific serine/threonine protein kinase n=1 Tax=Paraburkholderia phenazinium TaxID=60549 RepID=A0A1N6KFF3_9BURK|nr:serine/threonine-protein kinase [Paraburkholderia phenazinium]SIO55314.1 non-specific serine/threonine protein kinase [Paraburkholderia phenazinium]